MEKFVSVDDYEKSALQTLPKAVKDYYASGAGKEFSLQWNKDAFKTFVFILLIIIIVVFF